MNASPARLSSLRDGWKFLLELNRAALRVRKWDE
jgi:hypothetical protein